MRVAPGIDVDESELEEQFVRASGPGGQNVNKVASAVQLRFDAARSPAIGAEMLERLRRVAGRRMTAEGVLLIDARRFRTQERNREDARARLLELLREAARRPRPRRATRPTAGSRERRLQQKRERAGTKRLRGRPADGD